MFVTEENLDPLRESGAADTWLLSVNADERATIVTCLRACLSDIEDWEFTTLIGRPKADVEGFLAEWTGLAATGDRS